MNNEDIYKEAAKRVKAKKGFFYHFIVYACVIGILYAIMYFENDGNLLPTILVALGWGIGLAIHYVKVFGTKNLDIIGISPDWEEEELEQELAKLRRRKELKERIAAEKSLLDDEENLELKQIEKRLADDDLKY